MNEDAELKPCPFCGAPAELEQGSDHHGAWFNLGCSRHWGHVRNPDYTNTCIAGRIFYTETDVPLSDAITAWNIRAQSDAAALVEALAKRRPFVMEQVDAGVWSLVLRFGKGIDSNQAMRETADVVRAALSACEQARGA